MRPIVRQLFRPKIDKFEGTLPYPYADKLGLVTTGVGNLLEDASSHKPLAFYFDLPWKNKTTGEPATREEMQAAFDAVKAHTAGGSEKDLSQNGGGAYKDVTNIILDDTGVTELFNSRLNINDGLLNKRYPAFEAWPADAQMALHFMAWAMGAGRLSEFVGMNTALSGLLPDFFTASKLSNCKGCTDERNKATRDMLVNAGLAVTRKADFDALYWPSSPDGDNSGNALASLTSGSHMGRDIAVTVIGGAILIGGYELAKKKGWVG